MKKQKKIAADEVQPEPQDVKTDSADEVQASESPTKGFTPSEGVEEHEHVSEITQLPPEVQATADAFLDSCVEGNVQVLAVLIAPDGTAMLGRLSALDIVQYVVPALGLTFTDMGIPFSVVSSAFVSGCIRSDNFVMPDELSGPAPTSPETPQA